MQGPCTILNPPATTPAQRTVVILGQFRGGTSMVAAVVRRLGVFMGHRFDPRNNHEDLDFQHASTVRVRHLVRFRNEEQDVWGWKYPGTLLTVEEWYRELRNPRFIVVFRDPLAAAQTELRVGEFADPVATLKLKHEHAGRLLQFVERAAAEGLPMLLVSHERALAAREELVDSIASFLDVAADAHLKRAALEQIDPAAGYRDLLPSS
jgi:hypothetical protein